jgi:hypothetical protein
VVQLNPSIFEIPIHIGWEIQNSVGDDAMNCPNLIYVAPILLNNLHNANGVLKVSGSLNYPLRLMDSI